MPRWALPVRRMRQGAAEAHAEECLVAPSLPVPRPLYSADMNRRQLLRRLLTGSRNVRFDDLVNLAEGFGFQLVRVSGSHHIFRHLAVPARLNLQERRGEAKPYQVSQFLKLVERYNLQLADDE